MKHVAIVSAHFVPSNLTAVHRARILSEHLFDYGWWPTVVTVDEKYYEERLDHELRELLPSDLEVVKGWAFPARPFRLIGDIGIRGFLGMLQQIGRLHARRKIDFLYITIPSNFAAPLGRLAYHRYRIPYGIDFQDPWFHPWPGVERRFSKAWFSYRLSGILEPWSVRHASLITSVSPAYHKRVVSRNSYLKNQAVIRAVPFGWLERDFEYVRHKAEPTMLFSENDGQYHLVYLGAMLPGAYPLLKMLLEAIAGLAHRHPDWMKRFRLHFIGTGKSPDDLQGFNVRPYVEKYGLGPWIQEHPQRIGYLDALNHCMRASGVLILGSTERHYTPSKVFPAVMCKRPILAILHEQSEAVNLLVESKAGAVVAFEDGKLPAADRVAEALEKQVMQGTCAPSVRWDCWEPYSARHSAEILASAMDQALERFRRSA